MSRPSALAVLRLTTNWSTPAPERRHLNMVPRIRTRRQGSGQDSAEHFQHALNFCRSAMAAVVCSSTRYKRDSLLAYLDGEGEAAAAQCPAAQPRCQA